MNYPLNEVFKKLNYCVICGGKLKINGRNLLTCISNKHRYYINPKPCNAAILTNKKGEILLVKRKFPPKKNFWDLPGGFIDLAETAEESMSRELKEELGIDIENFKYIGSFYDLYSYQDLNYPTISFVFSTHVEDQKMEPADDISEIQFFSVEKIPYDKLAFESLKEAIKKFLG